MTIIILSKGETKQEKETIMGRGGNNNFLQLQALTLNNESFIQQSLFSEKDQYSSTRNNKEETALIIVDVQHDFLPGGALAVPDGDQVIQPIVKAAATVGHVFASRDWHPENHLSFAKQGGPWPKHCVAGTHGANLHPKIQALVKNENIINKATTTEKDAYSAFNGTKLDEKLKQLGVKKLYVTGLATDYCVKQTVIDACKLGYSVTVLKQACRGVNVNSNDSNQAYQEMEQSGSSFVDNSVK
jgi:nicotinamidase/pyrazinamidase